MTPAAKLETVRSIMLDFARRTGLSPESRIPIRYLWTDAFAVCNYLDLYRNTQEDEFRRLALQLVDQVHRVLGRHRADDPRSGWISGLNAEAGARHPTRGGLRIGKRQNERAVGQRADPRLEWEQDGQYFHYLTKWMGALERVSQVSGESVYHEWAMELALAAHRAFCYAPPGGGSQRLYWKMSIDLTRPLVSQMGQHDALDGWLTCLELQTRSHRQTVDLTGPIEDYRAMTQSISFLTDDPLGIGGLLTDAHRSVRLMQQGVPIPENLPGLLLGAARRGLAVFAGTGQLELPAQYRLAFRELGLSIGLHAVDRLQSRLEKAESPPAGTIPWAEKIQAVRAFASLTHQIESCWLDHGAQRLETWMEHQDINAVMLATSLSPAGYLES